MAIYAMSDLHLSHAKPKPMDIFDPIWLNHTEKILDRWNSTVGKEDYVLVPGDVSWGGSMDEAKPDLDFISALNGYKVMLTGNHDYYWNSTQKLNDMYDNMFFLKNNYYVLGDRTICGTRGWLCPYDARFTEHDRKIYNREVGRLKRSIELALNSGRENITVMMHFPPTNDKGEESEFISVLKQYDIKRVIYGHLHGVDKYETSLLGDVDGIEYSLVSADYLDFKPMLIYD
jgi:hypothetical protein